MSSRNRKTMAYDVVLSFAGENRPVVSQLAAVLDARGIRVFYDEFEQAALWGKDLYGYRPGRLMTV